MTLKEMSVLWSVPLKSVHDAAIVVNGGPLGRGRKKWTKESEDAIYIELFPDSVKPPY